MTEEIEKTIEVQTVELNGINYLVVKKGIEQANQIAAFSNWLGKYALPSLNPEAEQTGVTGNYILNLLSGLSGQALVDLFVIVVGCSKKVADEQFDFGVLVEAVMIFWDNQPGIQRIVNRFFSTTS